MRRGAAAKASAPARLATTFLPSPYPSSPAGSAVPAVTTSRGMALQSASPTDTASDDVAVLMKSVGERVRDYYDRVTSVICTETVLQEELRADLSPLRRLQETVYDLMIVRQPSLAGHVQGEVVVERRLKSIDGRPVRAEDRPH